MAYQSLPLFLCLGLCAAAWPRTVEEGKAWLTRNPHRRVVELTTGQAVTSTVGLLYEGGVLSRHPHAGLEKQDGRPSPRRTARARASHGACP